MLNRLEQNRLKPNLDDASRFLSFFDRNEHVFQTFGEGEKKGERRLLKETKGSFDKLKHQLACFNKEGACVSFTVNELGGDKHRCDENVTRIRAVWCDYNSRHYDKPLTLEELLAKFPLKPSIQVNTSPGSYHFYWLVGDYWPCDEQGIKDFDGVMARMAESYYCDSTAKPRSKDLRAPGFLHMKGEPWLVTFDFLEDNFWPDTAMTYCKEEIIKAFPPIYRQEKEATARSGDKDWRTYRDRIREALWCIPADDYEDWRNVGFALHWESDGSDNAKAMFDEWSQTCLRTRPSETYDQDGQDSLWGGIKHDHANPITAGWIFHKAKGTKKGKQEVSLTENNLIKADWIEPGPITQEVIKRLKPKFAEWGHDPSAQLLKALTHISTTLVAQAEGNLAPCIYLSSIDPGGGKTETLIETIKVLLEVYPDYNAILCLGTYDEIKRISKKFNKDEFACFTRDKEVNQLGLGEKNKDEAPILLTTQQMVDARLKEKGFIDADEFYYKGKPRIGRAWDESILLGDQLILDSKKIAAMLVVTQKDFPDWTEQAQNLFVAITQATEDQAVEVPNLYQFTHEYEIRELFKDCDDDDKVTADDVSMLFRFSERTVNVVRDNTKKTKMICYVETLPDDIWPVIVLDASSSFRKTYQFMNDVDNNIRQLETAKKNYENATFHVCPKGGGKSTINLNPEKYIQGVSRQIDKSDLKQLVVHHKNLNISFNEEVDKLVTGDKSRVGYLTYGKHAGTNEFSDRTIVILAGTLFYDPATKHLLVRLTKKLKPDQKPTGDDLKLTELSESANCIFQAAGRGAIRLSDGEGCPECHIYLYARPEVSAVLKVIFPGCNVVSWDGVEEELTGNEEKIVAYVREKNLTAIEDRVYDTEVMIKALKLDPKRSRKYFKKLVKEGAVRTVLGEDGIAYCTGSDSRGNYFEKQLDTRLF